MLHCLHCDGHNTYYMALTIKESTMLEFVLGLSAGFVISAIWAWWIIRRARQEFDRWLSATVTELEQEQEKEQQPIPVRVEQHGEQFYLYHTDTGQFIVQGRSIKEMLERMQHSDQVFNVVDGDPAVVAQLRSQVTAVS